MSSIIFAWLTALGLMVPERLFSRAATGHALFDLDIIPIWIFYLGVNFSFGSGLIALLPVSYLLGFYSYQSPFVLMMTHVMLFLSIKILMEQIMTEAYLTKMFWTIFFLVINGFLMILAFGSSFLGLLDFSVWKQILLTALVSGVIGLPLMVLLDSLYALWARLVAPHNANLTGADFYQIKSQQRKYLE